MKRGAGIGVIVVAAVGALASPGCLGEEATATQVFACPNKVVFTGVPPAPAFPVAAVSGYMERRCGTLDCHGAATIPMRLYGQFGRRLPDEGNVPGGAPTTAAELDANYATACSIEPEKTAEQVENFGQKAEELLIVRKARGIEGHKGGTIVKEGDPGDQCIVGWLRGLQLDAVSKACQDAIGLID
jgi:hypothetical protein